MPHKLNHRSRHQLDQISQQIKAREKSFVFPLYILLIFISRDFKIKIFRITFQSDYNQEKKLLFKEDSG